MRESNLYILILTYIITYNEVRFIKSPLFEKALKPINILTAKRSVSKLFSNRELRPSRSPGKTVHPRSEQEFQTLQALRQELSAALAHYPRKTRKAILYEMNVSSNWVSDPSLEPIERLGGIADLRVFVEVLKDPAIVRMLSKSDAPQLGPMLSFMRSVAMHTGYFCMKERRAGEIARINKNELDASVLDLVERDRQERVSPSLEMFEAFVKRAVSGSLVAGEEPFSSLVQKLGAFSNDGYLAERVLADSAAKNPAQAREFIRLFFDMDVDALKEALKGADFVLEESLKAVLKVRPGLRSMGEFVDKLEDAATLFNSPDAMAEIIQISNFNKNVEAMGRQPKTENPE